MSLPFLGGEERVDTRRAPPVRDKSLDKVCVALALETISF